MMTNSVNKGNAMNLIYTLFNT